jgi:hypothetical protein
VDYLRQAGSIGEEDAPDRDKLIPHRLRFRYPYMQNRATPLGESDQYNTMTSPAVRGGGKGRIDHPPGTALLHEEAIEGEPE